MATRTGNAPPRPSGPPATEGLVAVLRRVGYSPKLPSRLVAAARLGCRIIRASRCPHCGHKGRRAVPLYRSGSFKLVASCPSCGVEEER